MFRKVYDLVRAEISGANAVSQAESVWRNDRTNSFDGFYRTAEHCREQLQAAGLAVQVVSFPADGTTPYGTMVLPVAWECRRAALHLLSPAREARRLASYPEEPFCCAQGSPATAGAGVEAEVVVLSGGGSARDYRGRDVAGRIILTDAWLSGVHQEAARHGAVGLICDAMGTSPAVRPDPMDLPDAQQWQMMRPSGELPAFVISPRLGKWLRGLISRQADTAEPVRLHLSVDATLGDGRVELISALLPGQEDEEVALMAHYAEPGANDNASGVGLSLEVMRVLGTLIRAGNLPRPRRGLRVWLTHEVYTLQALAVTDPQALRRVVGALNLDMVGEDMARCGSALMYQTTPDACPSYLNHLLRELLSHFRRGFYGWGNMGSSQPYFPTMETSYWGNDNFISDPSIGVPSVAFINWPDRYYHTSADVPANLNAETLARLGTLAATFAYTLAQAGKADALRLGELVAAQAAAQFEQEAGAQVRRVRDALEAAEPDLGALYEHGCRRLEYLGERELQALKALEALLSPAERAQAPWQARLDGLAEEIRAAESVARGRYGRLVFDLARTHGLAEPQRAPEKAPGRAARQAAALVPRRLTVGPVATDGFPQPAKDLLQRAGRDGLPAHLLYWIDGRRSLLEAGRLAALEDDREPVPSRRLLQWFEGMKLGGMLAGGEPEA